MEEDFIGKLIKNALTSAASAAGSKAGAAVAAYVLDLIGMSSYTLDDVMDELDNIETQMAATDKRISELMDQVKWTNATDSFDLIYATVNTHNTNIQAELAITDQAKREAGVKNYVLTAHPAIDTLDVYLTLIHDRMMGTGGGLTGTYTDPLVRTFIDTHWAEITDPDPAVVRGHIMGVYTKVAQFQRLAYSLLVAYRTATGDATLAALHRQQAESRLNDQFKETVKQLPDFLALDDMASPALKMKSILLRVEPSWLDVSGTVVASNAPFPVRWWQLARLADGKHYRLECVEIAGGAISYCAENIAQVTVDSEDFGPPNHPITKYVYATAHQLMPGSDPAAAIAFLVHPTEDVNKLALSVDDGRYLQFVDRGLAGQLLELAAGAPSATNGYATIESPAKLPAAVPPELSAWSAAFSAKPKGEGRFVPGFRVRYRVVHLNRFGESDKSDWLVAPATCQPDANGYFNGENDTYYFPQIKMVADPNGLTEGYRLYRQFEGGAEEEVTKYTVTGDPQGGGPVIWDDFTP